MCEVEVYSIVKLSMQSSHFNFFINCLDTYGNIIQPTINFDSNVEDSWPSIEYVDSVWSVHATIVFFDIHVKMAAAMTHCN